ncbi:hypothetical protein PINS_up015200 [Pythium insidiosum]|nr:hypothetical protein PINS_up015200 [Pythium insidiosum]
MEALQGGHFAHKENVEANVDRSKVALVESKARTPQGRYHPYGNTPKAGKLSANSSAKKPRRALGDISNQHRGGPLDRSLGSSTGKRSGDGPLKPMTPFKTPQKSKKALSASKGNATPRVQKPVVDDVDDIEFAFGGLPDAADSGDVIARIQKEIIAELMADKTPTVLDHMPSPRSREDLWAKERNMLESGQTPSPWWSEESSVAETLVFSELSNDSTIDLNVEDPLDTTFDPDEGLLEEAINTPIPDPDDI